MITPENIVIHELIGLKAEVVDSTNPQVIGINGSIVNETKSMFEIQTKKGFKMIQKQHNKWKFFLKENQVILTGSLLQKRSQDRLGIKI